MKKPVVFLSHSAQNKKQLVALRSLLNRKAAGLLDFFLSCDGESIPLGTNWVARLDKALRETKLMFVFVSRESLQSAWIPFEAGYSYGKGKHVVPCCLPGVDIKDLPPPLSLLQAHTLHSAADLRTLVQKCNKVFQTKIPAEFTRREFDSVFSPPARTAANPGAVAWEGLITKVEISVQGGAHGGAALLTMCRRRHLDCYAEESSRSARSRVHASGISMMEESEWFDDTRRERVEGGKERRYSITLAPELLPLTLPLLDAWRKKRRMKDFPEVRVSFNGDVTLEREPHRLTTKLFGSGISVFDRNFFGFRKMRFVLSGLRQFGDGPPQLSFPCFGRLQDQPLADLITILASREVLLVPRSLLKAINVRAAERARNETEHDT